MRTMINGYSWDSVVLVTSFLKQALPTYLLMAYQSINQSIGLFKVVTYVNINVSSSRAIQYDLIIEQYKLTTKTNIGKIRYVKSSSELK